MKSYTHYKYRSPGAATHKYFFLKSKTRGHPQSVTLSKFSTFSNLEQEVELMQKMLKFD